MRQLSQAAQAAKMIRNELKQAFKGVKFTVTSQYYAGGCSVDIYKPKDIDRNAVDKIVSKYQYGQFDGMTDSYDVTNNRTDIPQVQYVLVQNHYQ